VAGVRAEIGLWTPADRMLATFATIASRIRSEPPPAPARKPRTETYHAAHSRSTGAWLDW
jgi:hypothetical protein